MGVCIFNYTVTVLGWVESMGNLRDGVLSTVPARLRGGNAERCDDIRHTTGSTHCPGIQYPLHRPNRSHLVSCNMFYPIQKLRTVHNTFTTYTTQYICYIHYTIQLDLLPTKGYEFRKVPNKSFELY